MKDHYINQNVLIWGCAMFALFKGSQDHICGCFMWFAATICFAASVSVVACLWAYTKNYCDKKLTK